MSHFTIVKTQIKDVAGLLKALDDKGFKDVEVHDEAVHLLGYAGDIRPETAEIVIRRQYIGSASNDIGFKRQEDGNYTAIISAYDRSRYSAQWLGELMQRYSYCITRTKLVEQGFQLVEERTAQDGRVHIVARRVV